MDSKEFSLQKTSDFSKDKRTHFKPMSKSRVLARFPTSTDKQKDSQSRRAILSKFRVKQSANNKFPLWKNPRIAHFNQGKIARHTATSLLPYFISKGKFSQREGLFAKYLFNQAISYKREKAITPSSYFPVFVFAATPFVRLKTRGSSRTRRIRLAQKLTYRPKLNGQRQAFLLFSKSLRSGALKGKKNFFKNKFQVQRESLLQRSRRRFQAKSKKKGRISRRQNNVTVSTTGIKSLRDTRDEIHLRAYQIRPRFWRRKNKKNLRTPLKEYINLISRVAQR